MARGGWESLALPEGRVLPDRQSVPFKKLLKVKRKKFLSIANHAGCRAVSGVPLRGHMEA